MLQFLEKLKHLVKYKPTIMEDMCLDDALDRMEADHQALEDLRKNVPIINLLLDAAELECSTWNEDFPADSEQLIVESIHELCQRYAEARVTMRSFNNCRWVAREEVLRELNAMLAEKKRMGEAGVDEAIREFNGSWWTDQIAER